MYRATFGIAGVLVVAALVGLSFAPVASATRYDIDITKTVKGYTIHVFGWIDVDKQAKTVSGHLPVTVTNPAGVVIFDKMYDFTFTWIRPRARSPWSSPVRGSSRSRSRAWAGSR